jgi:hypothetical protein
MPYSFYSGYFDKTKKKNKLAAQSLFAHGPLLGTFDSQKWFSHRVGTMRMLRQRSETRHMHSDDDSRLAKRLSESLPRG